MSKLNELIRELCPDGVEYKTLQSIAEVGTGNSNRVDANDEGMYPFYVRSKDVMRSNKYIFDEEAIIIPGEGGIGDIFHYACGKYDLHQRAYRIHFEDSRINTKFAYYYLMANFKKFIMMKAVNATVSSIRKPMIESFLLPVPPLPVQEEIVRILNKFTALEAELEAELEARKKQYEYYRNVVLVNIDGNCKYKKIGDVCLRTENISWSGTDDTMFKYIDLTSVDRDTHAIGETSKINSHIAPSRAQRIIATNDIIFGTTRPTLKRFCIIPHEYNGQICSTGFCVLRANKAKVLPKFLYYQISKSIFYDYIETVQRGSAYPAVSDTDIKSFEIPIPPLAEQERIVAILDRFDALVNDITQGLPAEIAARRKQYEYYRDKLLTFKEAVS